MFLKVRASPAYRVLARSSRKKAAFYFGTTLKKTCIVFPTSWNKSNNLLCKILFIMLNAMLDIQSIAKACTKAFSPSCTPFYSTNCRKKKTTYIFFPPCNSVFKRQTAQEVGLVKSHIMTRALFQVFGSPLYLITTNHVKSYSVGYHRLAHGISQNSTAVWLTHWQN